jgi:hypothetical protein
LRSAFFGSAPFAASVFGACGWAQMSDQHYENIDMAWAMAVGVRFGALRAAVHGSCFSKVRAGARKYASCIPYLGGHAYA